MMVKKATKKKPASVGGSKAERFKHSLKTVPKRELKPKAAKPAKEAATERKPVTHRITTHKPNAPSSQAVAPRVETAEPSGLGPILLPEPDEAQRILKGLAELNDRAVAAGKVYQDLKDRTKTAKDKWEGLAEEVQTKLRLATHGSDLPLFDAIEREADHGRMVEAAKAPAETPAPAVQEVAGEAPGDPVLSEVESVEPGQDEAPEPFPVIVKDDTIDGFGIPF